MCCVCHLKRGLLWSRSCTLFPESHFPFVGWLVATQWWRENALITTYSNCINEHGLWDYALKTIVSGWNLLLKGIVLKHLCCYIEHHLLWFSWAKTPDMVHFCCFVIWYCIMRLILPWLWYFQFLSLEEWYYEHRRKWSPSIGTALGSCTMESTLYWRWCFVLK